MLWVVSDPKVCAKLRIVGGFWFADIIRGCSYSRLSSLPGDCG